MSGASIQCVWNLTFIIVRGSLLHIERDVNRVGPLREPTPHARHVPRRQRPGWPTPSSPRTVITRHRSVGFDVLAWSRSIVAWGFGDGLNGSRSRPRMSAVMRD